MRKKTTHCALYVMSSHDNFVCKILIIIILTKKAIMTMFFNLNHMISDNSSHFYIDTTFVIIKNVYFSIFTY